MSTPPLFPSLPVSMAPDGELLAYYALSTTKASSAPAPALLAATVLRREAELLRVAMERRTEDVVGHPRA